MKYLHLFKKYNTQYKVNYILKIKIHYKVKITIPYKWYNYITMNNYIIYLFQIYAKM